MFWPVFSVKRGQNHGHMVCYMLCRLNFVMRRGKTCMNNILTHGLTWFLTCVDKDPDIYPDRGCDIQFALWSDTCFDIFSDSLIILMWHVALVNSRGVKSCFHLVVLASSELLQKPSTVSIAGLPWGHHPIPSHPIPSQPAPRIVAVPVDDSKCCGVSKWPKMRCCKFVPATLGKHCHFRSLLGFYGFCLDHSPDWVYFGVYFVKFQDSQNLLKGKFIVEHSGLTFDC